MKLNLTFAGFYNSIHSDIVESNTERESENDTIKNFLLENNLEYFELFDYKQTYINYTKDFLIGFKQFLQDELYTVLNFDFISLDSPREYNFITDTINIEIKNEKELSILEYSVLNHESETYFKEKFIEHVKSVTTSCSGYVSYYNFDDVMNKIDEDHTNVFYSLLLSSLIEFYEDDYNFEPYFNPYEVESVVLSEYEKLF